MPSCHFTCSLSDGALGAKRAFPQIDSPLLSSAIERVVEVSCLKIEFGEKGLLLTRVDAEIAPLLALLQNIIGKKRDLAFRASSKKHEQQEGHISLVSERKKFVHKLRKSVLYAQNKERLMKCLLFFALTFGLVAEERGDSLLEITQPQDRFEEDQSDEEIANFIETPKIEVQESVDDTVDREMAAILQKEEVAEEDLEERVPEIEDLSHLAKRPSVTIAEPQASDTASAYEKLPISVVDKQRISAILTTMAENSVFKLLFQKKQLEKWGREINHVHPIRFLGSVFADPRLVHCMFEIRRSGFKWEGFIEGFSQRFLEELNAGNVQAYIPGLAESLHLNSRDLMTYVQYKDFEGLVLHLMEKSRQR